MSTILHSVAQAVGWAIGLLSVLITALVVPSFFKKALAGNAITSLPRKQQHRLFQGYWNHLEKKERYEEMEAISDLMLAYQDGKQPTSKQLKPYKLVVNKKLSLKGDEFKFITTRHITRAES